MPRAYAIQIAEAALPLLLDSLAEHLRYAYVETATSSEWRRFQAGETLPACLRGRAFGEGCDVQFRRGNDGYEVLVMSDAGRLPLSDAETLDLADFDDEEVRYVLWGERSGDQDVWSEPGMRQRWRYPVEGSPARVTVRATEYRDRASGELQFIRYLTLVPLEEADESV